MAWRLGHARIDRVEEQTSTVPLALLTDDADFAATCLATLPPTMFDAARRSFPLCFQSWIVRVDGLTIVVDPCNGNGRRRPGFPQFENLDEPWLERFAATGVAPGDVDLVFCTHLHCDHCGWNTRLQDGRYVPTFANAAYLFVRREYDRWNPDLPAGAEPRDAAAYNADVFEEAVRPIVEAGLARLIDTPHRVANGVWIEAAPGHTPGHAILFVRSHGVTACFSGDAVHHPAQIFRPELHMPGCDDLARAIATRRTLFARLSRDAAFIFPAHFGAPHHGRIDADGVAFRFRSGGAAIVPEESLQ